MKTAYQTNNGYYIKDVICQKSPLEKDVYLIPLGCVETKPPSFKENQIPFWNGKKWELLPNYSKKIYFSKHDKQEKIFKIGEKFDDSYTDIPPLENEKFQKWNEQGYWEKDNSSEEKYLKQIEESKILKRQNAIKTLLLESDYIELPSFLERKGIEKYNQWIAYRANLRLAYHDQTLSIPEFPIE